MKYSILLLSLLLGCSSTSKNLSGEGFDGGTGGESDSGGSGGESSGGNSSIGGEGGMAGSSTGGMTTGGSGPCVPKTCLTLEVEADADICGLVSDECGNFIECGGCQGGFGCGEDIEGNPEDNVCGKQCELKLEHSNTCVRDSTAGQYAFFCDLGFPIDSKPMPNCEVINWAASEGENEYIFCCPAFEY